MVGGRRRYGGEGEGSSELVGIELDAGVVVQQWRPKLGQPGCVSERAFRGKRRRRSRSFYSNKRCFKSCSIPAAIKSGRNGKMSCLGRKSRAGG